MKPWTYFSSRRFCWQMFFGLVVLAVILAAGRAHGQEATEKGEAWQKALPHIQQAERESLTAIDEAVADVNRRFDDAAPKIRPWVEDLLGLWGKLDFVVGSTQNFLNGAAGIFDDLLGTKLGKVAGEDRFATMARSSFTEKILDPADMEDAIKAAVKTYDAKLDAISAKLFVAINADVPDADMPSSAPAIAVNLPKGIFRHIDAALKDATDAATGDFLLFVGKELASQVGGNILAGTLMGGGAAAGHEMVHTGYPATDLAGAAVGFVAGMVVSYGIDKIQEFAGHDPVGTLAVKVGDRLVVARDAILKGNDNTGRNYSVFVLNRLVHRDTWARAACGQAVLDMQARTDLGLNGCSRLLTSSGCTPCGPPCGRRSTVSQPPYPPGFFGTWWRINQRMNWSRSPGRGSR